MRRSVLAIVALASLVAPPALAEDAPPVPEMSRSDATGRLRRIAAEASARVRSESPFADTMVSEAMKLGLAAASRPWPTQVTHGRIQGHDDDVQIVSVDGGDPLSHSVLAGTLKDVANAQPETSIRYALDGKDGYNAGRHVMVRDGHAWLISQDDHRGYVELSSWRLAPGVYALIECTFPGYWSGPRSFHQKSVRLISTQTGKSTPITIEELRAMPEPKSLATVSSDLRAKVDALGPSDGVERYRYRAPSFKKGKAVSGGLVRIPAR